MKGLTGVPVRPFAFSGRKKGPAMCVEHRRGSRARSSSRPVLLLLLVLVTGVAGTYGTTSHSAAAEMFPRPPGGLATLAESRFFDQTTTPTVTFNAIPKTAS